MKAQHLLPLAALSLLAALTPASAVTLTFDELADGTTLSAQYAALGVTFSPNAFSGTGEAQPASQFSLTITGDSITSVVVRPGSYDDWVGVDNIAFLPVPEPGTYALMVLGVLAVGAAASRRQAAARVAAT